MRVEPVTQYLSEYLSSCSRKHTLRIYWFESLDKHQDTFDFQNQYNLLWKMAHIVLQLPSGKEAEPKVAYFLQISEIQAYIAITF